MLNWIEMPAVLPGLKAMERYGAAVFVGLDLVSFVVSCDKGVDPDDPFHGVWVASVQPGDTRRVSLLGKFDSRGKAQAACEGYFAGLQLQGRTR